MEDSSPYTKSHFPYPELLNPTIQPNPIRRGKSCSRFVCKALIFALFMAILPLFPSQAPDFINQSLITKFWELLHLLFIGIAVSYGLFCRRNVEMGDENYSKIDSLEYDMSRMFHVSSMYEDGYENPYGLDEKGVFRSRNQHSLGEETTLCSDGSTVDEQCNPNLSISENGVENSCGYGEDSQVQAWNSQYFQGEPMVVVNQPNYAVDEWGEPRSRVDYKPLGLPVRSLKSRSRKRESPEYVNGNESGSGSSASSRNSDQGRNDGMFGDMGSQNFEQRFDEAVASPSPIPWRSRSGRMRMREKAGNVTRSSHFRPLSVDETQFESLKTRSLRSNLSFSSQGSFVSSSLGKYSPSHSIASDILSSNMEDVNNAKSSQGSCASSGSPSPPKAMERVVVTEKSSQGSYASSVSPSPPKAVERVVGKMNGSRGSYASSGSPSPPIAMERVTGKVKSSQGSYASSGSPSPPKAMESVVVTEKSSQGYYASSVSPSPPKVERVAGKMKSSRGSYASSGLPAPPIAMERVVSKVKSSQGSYASSGSPSPPKAMDRVVATEKSSQGYYASSVSPSPPKAAERVVGKMKSSRGSYASSGSPSPPKVMERVGGKVKSSQGASTSSGLPLSQKPTKGDVRTTSSQGSYVSGSPSPPKQRKRDVSKEKSSQGSSASGSPSPPKPLNDKASLSAFHTRGYSVGSLYDHHSISSKDYLKEFGGSRREDLLGSKESGSSSSLKPEMKPESLPKARLRGKSVRTIRPSGLSMESINYGGKHERQVDGRDEINNSDDPFFWPKHEHTEDQKKEMQQSFAKENVSAKSSDVSGNEAEKLQVSSSDEEVDSASVITTTTDSHEVDKKAGEFIAKFREQIRLQKMASIDRSRGLGLKGQLF
ncbi:hypothetical protein UlMin_044511 [Ulmus minor]